jgi:hypothetical protein
MRARMARLKRTGKRLGHGWAAKQVARRGGRRRKTHKSGFRMG